MTAATFTLHEHDTAQRLYGHAQWYVRQYCNPADHAAATIAVLRQALTLAGGDASADRLAVLEAEHDLIYKELIELRRELAA